MTPTDCPDAWSGRVRRAFPGFSFFHTPIFWYLFVHFAAPLSVSQSMPALPDSENGSLEALPASQSAVVDDTPVIFGGSDDDLERGGRAASPFHHAGTNLSPSQSRSPHRYVLLGDRSGHAASNRSRGFRSHSTSSFSRYLTWPWRVLQPYVTGANKEWWVTPFCSYFYVPSKLTACLRIRCSSFSLPSSCC